MTFDPQKPRYTLPFNGKEYELEGSFGLIEAAEYALKDNIISISMKATSMQVSQMSRLLYAILTHCGHKISHDEISETIFNKIGIAGDGYPMLCLHVHAFLRITIVPPSQREEAAKRVGELLKGKNTTPDTTSEITSDSA